MKIESRIKRRNGHSVEIDGATYEFRPPAYVAEVTNQAHIDRLLAITEGYVAVADPHDANGDGDVDRAELVEAYEAKFGQRPHHRLSTDKIRAALDAPVEIEQESE